MIFWYGVAFALMIILVTSLLNALSFPRLKRERADSMYAVPASPVGTRYIASVKPQNKNVSILIPARNEAHTIASTIQHLLAQQYDSYEIILLDDQSEDGTAAIACAAAKNDSRLKIIMGQPLPAGWLGKNWACHQLSKAAQSDILIFTDADVEWQPNALPALLPHFEKYDLLTVWPAQKTVTWSERLCVSAIALAIIGYLPEIMVRLSPFAIFAAANGQCLAFKRTAYEKIGGHEAVKDKIVEDVALAKKVKQQGLKLMMLDGNHLISCRMYRSRSEVRNGFAKNILAGHGNSLLFLALSTVFHWSVFVLPWLWLIFGGIIPMAENWPLFPLMLVVIGLLVRAISLYVTHQRVSDAIFMPLTVIFMTVIAAQSAWWQIRYGGPEWKGRTFVRQ